MTFYYISTTLIFLQQNSNIILLNLFKFQINSKTDINPKLILKFNFIAQ